MSPPAETPLTPAAVLEACRVGRIRAGDRVVAPASLAGQELETFRLELSWYGVGLELAGGEEFRVERGRGTREANRKGVQRWS